MLAAASENDDTPKCRSAELLTAVLASDDTKEGLRALLEKRPPAGKAS